MTSDSSATWRREGGELPRREMAASLVRGACHRCPSCGHGRLFRTFLKVTDACPECAEPLHHHRADDAPPYFTITVVGHILIPAVLIIERVYKPELWVHGLLWTSLALILSVLLLPTIKGALVGYQWALYMHGFDPRSGGDQEWDGVGFKSWQADP